MAFQDLKHSPDRTSVLSRTCTVHVISEGRAPAGHVSLPDLLVDISLGMGPFGETLVLATS